MATIKEVAKACNVSIATVSNIINGKGRVSEETKKRIMETAKEMGYVPNMMAKSLKQGSSKAIGIITEDLTVFNCAEIVDGIHEYLEEQGYTSLLGNLRLYKKYENGFYHHEDYKKQVEEEFLIMQSKQVEGIIYIGAHCREIKSIPEKLGIPLVVAYGFASDRQIPSVIFDDEQAAYEAACELIRCGHTRLGIISGELESLHTAGRLIGYQRALYENHILYNPKLNVVANWSRTQGYQVCEKLMKEKVTAIFAMSDVMAAGVYDYAGENDIEIGKDIALIGFDNRQISTAFKPSLTTMALPLHQIGKSSAALIVDMVEGNAQKSEKNTYKINCTLEKRGSTGETIHHR